MPVRLPPARPIVASAKRILPPCRWKGTAAVLLATLLVAACDTPEPRRESVATLLQHPAEHAFVDGLRNYENAAFEISERDFTQALHEGLQAPHDTAIAHKHLAFIACAFNRIAECEDHFRSAFAAEPGFALSDAEIGHPVWGPVYRRVAAAMAARPH